MEHSNLALNSIIASTLGLAPPWEVDEVSFSADRKRLDIHIVFVPEAPVSCLECHTPFAGSSGNSNDTAIWFHHNFLSYETYLHAHGPKNPCCHTLYANQPPWSRTGSRFIQYRAV